MCSILPGLLFGVHGLRAKHFGHGWGQADWPLWDQKIDVAVTSEDSSVHPESTTRRSVWATRTVWATRAGHIYKGIIFSSSEWNGLPSSLSWICAWRKVVGWPEWTLESGRIIFWWCREQLQLIANNFTMPYCAERSCKLSNDSKHDTAMLQDTRARTQSRFKKILFAMDRLSKGDEICYNWIQSNLVHTRL